MGKINISNLKFGFDKILFNDLNVEIKENCITTLLGANSTGKTTLAKILCGIIKIDKVSIDNQIIKAVKLRSVTYYLSDTSIPTKQTFEIIKKNINSEIIEQFNIKPLLTKKNINIQECQLLCVIEALLSNNLYIIFDNILHETDIKTKILKYITDNKITLINITNNSEEILFGNNIIILGKEKIVASGKTMTILKKEKILRENHIEIPFMIDLSTKLKYYDLIDNPILNMNEMVDELWK